MSIKWTKAPMKTYWGDMMVQAHIEIDADHTLSLYCELDQADKVTAMLNEANELRAALLERDALKTHNTMLRVCLKNVIKVADRKTDEFDAAKAALGEP